MITRIVSAEKNIRVSPLDSHVVSEDKYYGVLWHNQNVPVVGYVGRRCYPNGEFAIMSCKWITSGSRLICLDEFIEKKQVDMHNLRDVIEKLVARSDVQVYEFTTHNELFTWLADALNSEK